VLYFADAFAWDYLSQTNFMPEFWTERRPLETVLGYSSTILPCLVSGEPPARTGIWTEYYRADRPPHPVAVAIVRSGLLLTPVNLARLVLFRFARKAGLPSAHKLRIPLQFAHHFARHDMDYRRFPPVDLPVPTLLDAAREHGLRFFFRYLRHGYDLTAELSALDRALSTHDVLFYYDPSIDGRGHRVGPDVAKLAPDLGRVAAFCHEVWARIGTDDVLPHQGVPGPGHARVPAGVPVCVRDLPASRRRRRSARGERDAGDWGVRRGRRHHGARPRAQRRAPQ
jgi:hypothetical protein